MKLFIYHTPETAPKSIVPDCAVAIDVLRATSTIVTALNSGAEAVQVFSDIDELMARSETWNPHQRLRAGERGGAKVDGCDLGNSPLDCTPEVVTGKRLFMSTTNGTRTLELVREAKSVFAGALINRWAIVEAIIRESPSTLWLVGSGWEGSFALEDTVCAGAIAYQLMTRLNLSLSSLAGNDEVVDAISLYETWQDKLLDLFQYASHGQRLLKLDGHEDLKYCSQLDTINVVPTQTSKGVLSLTDRQ